MISSRNWLKVLVLPVLGFLAPELGAETAGDINNTTEVEGFLEGAVSTLMAEHHTASGVVALHRKGEMITLRGYGKQDYGRDIPVDPQSTLFRVGSTSKLFTWVAVMQLVEKGKLDLDTDVNQYLSGVQIKNTWPGQPVTLRHIMTHTAGFEDGFLGYVISLEHDQLIPLAEAMRRYQPERINAPGEVSAYSNYATALAGLVVAEASGTTFDKYIQDNIFSVLGMSNSSFSEPLPPGLSGHEAIAYTRSRGSYQAQPYELISSFGPAGAMASTAPDMVRFGRALLNGGELDGGRILKASSVATMLASHHSLDPRLQGMGLGFLFYPASTPAKGHDGGTVYFGTHFAILPEEDAVIFTSFSGPGFASVFTRLKSQFYQHFFPVERKAPIKTEAATLREYLGEYQTWRASFSKIDKLNSLNGRSRVSTANEGQLLIDDSLFRAVAKDLFQAPESGRVIAFTRDEEGRVNGFVENGQPYKSMFRLPWYATSNFQLITLVLALLLCLNAFLAGIYQRRSNRLLDNPERSAFKASFWAATSHLVVLVFGLIAIAMSGATLLQQIPLLIKFWLFTPLLASVATAWLLAQTIKVWSGKAKLGTFGGFRFSLTTLASLALCWLYYYWNILGFQYLA